MAAQDRVLVRYLERSQDQHAKRKAKRDRKGSTGIPKKRRTRRRAKTNR